LSLLVISTLWKGNTLTQMTLNSQVALLVDSESSDKDDPEVTNGEVESGEESDKRHKAALEKLEKASEDSFLGQASDIKQMFDINVQGLRVIDHSVDNFASGDWQALGNAIKGGSDLVHKLENSAVNIAKSIQHGGLPATPGSITPSILETGKTFTAKGMEALELLGRETMYLLISETGMDVDMSSKEVEGKIDEDQFFEEVTFDRCFLYLWRSRAVGGLFLLILVVFFMRSFFSRELTYHMICSQELESLSNHYAMLFNRKKAKVPSDQRSSYDGKLKEVQQIFDLRSEVDGNDIESEKGKKVETGTWDSTDEVKNLHDSSVNKAAELAAGFANALAGLAPNDMIQRTTGRLDTLHSEGVHRFSELCCFAVTQLLVLGKSIISDANKVMDQDVKEETEKIHWPEDSIERANVIRAKAQSMTRCVQAVSSSFITGISDVAEAYLVATKGASSGSQDSQKSIQETANVYSGNLRADHSTAIDKIQDGIQYLSYVIVSTSMSAA
ncbi:hypothetical protein H5410_052215, partial [Solanum commersonii]